MNMTPPAYKDEQDGLVANGHDPEARAEPRRVILTATTPGSISERLLHALRLEFPWCDVERVSRVDAACTAFAHPVALILVDAQLMKAVEEASAALSRQHPQAIAALIEVDDHKPVSSINEVLASRVIRGVLPMNLGLDAWLAVIRLMLCGGEYYPPRMLRAFAERHSLPIGPRTRLPHGRENDITELTAREMQILEMVSRGLQNKTIAAEFRLSEHTVKIHLHNIISKLGAHNRTEAAARFRYFQERSVPSSSGEY
ncbi:helix-turn-helix transcriptional regulator [Mesorhizobium sp. L-8-10]|uniref:helix-turn-helix transcriptional regulator n=1 Tax=Mesorhizobium sp. L-8-10 TaxID=2744523 RepID=UPI001936CCF8|nr:response regulator transcription factor [Mesorhizobium sp. L-8-10]BCH35538.1 helix-turn-helix transcriptional regulator [Mesorhizobium sp. L-8-10]